MGAPLTEPLKSALSLLCPPLYADVYERWVATDWGPGLH